MLGQTVRRLRQERGLGQAELGEQLGVSKQSVSNWENGNITPPIDVLVRLADYFGVSTDYLLDRGGRRTLDVTGLPSAQVTHIQLLIEDLRAAQPRTTATAQGGMDSAMLAMGEQP